MSDFAKRILVSGRVQGVFFRASARRKACQLGISGFVRNLSNGQVEAVVCGEVSALAAFINWCGKGPLAARVNDVQVSDTNLPTEVSGFEIKD